MPKSSHNQTSFLSGEWSKAAQGQHTDPFYHFALDTCTNAVPLEEGCLARRPGTFFIAQTYGGGYARLITFQSRESNAFVMEFTAGHLRFISGNSFLCRNDDAPIVITDSSGPIVTSPVHGLTEGDQVILWYPDDFDPVNMPLVPNGVYDVYEVDSTTEFFMQDALANDYSGTVDFSGAAVRQIINIETVYTADQLPDLRSVQASTEAVLLHGDVRPYVLTECPSFDLNAIDFVDGPYQDSPMTMSATVSGYSGSITLTAASAAFATTDTSGSGGTGTFDRHVRLYTEPAAWASGTTYSAGQTVTYQGSFWQAITGSTGSYPNTAPTLWAPAVNVQQWAWGKITAYSSATVVTVTLTTALNTTNGTTVAAHNWYLGLYSDTTGFPSCGSYAEGRLWLAGAEENRFDASMSNDLFTFSPTDIYGNIADNNAIAEVLNSDETNAIFWITPDHQGLILGTLGGEFLVQASANEDVITPTSVSAHRVTKYGVANVEPRRAGMALIFVHRYSQRLYEFLNDAFSGKYTGRSINEKSLHLTTSGIAEIAYMQEPTPVIWVRLVSGQLIGVTYRRNSRFTTEAPVFTAWHKHLHGG